MTKFIIVSSRRSTQAEKDAVASTSDARKRNTERSSIGNDWYPLFTILSNHTVVTSVDGVRRCVTCGPVLSGGGQAHLTDAILAAGWKPPKQAKADGLDAFLIVVETTRFTGSSTSVQNIKHWMAGGKLHEGGMQTGDMGNFTIETLEGVMTVSLGDYVVKDINGDFYVRKHKPDILAATDEQIKRDDKPEIDFTAAVEVAARLLWEQACSEIEYDWQTNAEIFRKQASEILTLALPHMLPQISDDIAQVLEDEGHEDQ